MPRLIIYSIYTRFNTSVQRMERSVNEAGSGNSLNILLSLNGEKREQTKE